MTRGKRFVAAIVVAAVVGLGAGIEPAPADAASASVMRFIAKAIAQGVVYETIKTIVIRDYRMTEADFRTAYAAGLAAYNRAASIRTQASWNASRTCTSSPTEMRQHTTLILAVGLNAETTSTEVVPVGWTGRRPR